ncbi:MAG: SPFH domain-containing protein [Gammaproteobacteria bacterium]
MNNKLLTGLFIGVVIAVVGIFLIESSLYSVEPGQVAVEIQHGQVTASTREPGLHWKPVSAELATMDSRIQVSSGTFNADTRKPNERGSARYAIVWRLNQARTYYEATQGKGEVAEGKVDDAVAAALHKLLANPPSHAVFAVPPASVNAALTAALKPVAAKLGIDILSANITDTTLSKSAQKQVVESMLQADSAIRQAEQAKTQTAAAKKLAATRARAAAILAAANQQAASLKGEGEAQVAGIYAKASQSAPTFFRFYQTLLNEQASLGTHTRLFIISTDSPWFNLLGTKPGTDPQF